MQLKTLMKVLLPIVLSLSCVCVAVSFILRGDDAPVNEDVSVECDHSNSTLKEYREANCIEEGEQTYICSDCGETFVKETFPALGHIPTGLKVTEQATCVKDGKREDICTRCEEVLQSETIPATGHNYENRVCINCGEPEPACKHPQTEWIISKQPSCAEAGEKKNICNICGDVVKIEEIAKLAHTPSDWIVDKEATCTESGSKHKECTECGAETETESIAKLAHTISDWIIDKAATCTESGSKHKECTVCTEKLNAETINSLGHDFEDGICTRCGAGIYDDCKHTSVTDWIVEKPSTCTAEGTKYKQCTVCGIKTDTASIPKAEHTASDWVVDKEPTCTAAGSKYSYCTICNEKLKSENISALGHNYENGVCARCKAKKDDIGFSGTYNREGAFIYFGCYPQSEVTDFETLRTLGECIGLLPTSDNHQDWIDYKYYIKSSNATAFMWYKDVICGGIKYRAVYFTSYRPEVCSYPSSAINGNQSDNGYNTGAVYWFKFEPIKWRILTESNGSAFLMCDIIIDSQQYYHSTELRKINGMSIYSDNYAESDIRTWLNQTFYEIAFSELQQSLIKTTMVDNSAASTNPNNNPRTFNDGININICKNTKDKVFLLSQKEVTNSLYGFKSNYELDEARLISLSDYAKSQGCYSRTNDDEAPVSFGWWWLRSPSYKGYGYVYHVRSSSSYVCIVEDTSLGVVPALWLNLNGAGNCSHANISDWIVGKQPTCTESGSKYKQCALCGIKIETVYISALGHAYSDWIVDKEATCAEAGGKHKECVECGNKTTQSITKLAHTPSDWIVDKKASCTESGIRYNYCTVCSEKLSIETIPIIGHNYVNGICTRCRVKEETFIRSGNYIYFGSYPQTKVTDSLTLNALNSYTGALPICDNDQDWTDYKYYIEGRNTTAFMWYKDVSYNGAKYRAVYFTNYRPYYCDYSSLERFTYQDDNGYNTGTVYWFKYEPIKWRILMESNGSVFLMSEMAVDSQQYYHADMTIRTVNGKEIYANNYAESEIRAWLNGVFYPTAFNYTQQCLIRTTLVDNTTVSTNPYNNPTKWSNGVNDYVCEDTYDKIFLLSEKEVTNWTYGFSSSTETSAIRQLKGSDYAKSQGFELVEDINYLGSYCWWWLRSPSYRAGDIARGIDDRGRADDDFAVNYTYIGVVPALWMTL